MLHFASSIVFGVDVVDLYELRRALQRQSIILPRTEIENIAGRCDKRRNRGNLVIEIECFIESSRIFEQTRYDVCLLL